MNEEWGPVGIVGFCLLVTGMVMVHVDLISSFFLIEIRAFVPRAFVPGVIMFLIGAILSFLEILVSLFRDIRSQGKND